MDKKSATVKKWLQYAEEDLLAAEKIIQFNYAPPRLSCFLAQQSVEKAIKAILIYLQKPFPKTHDLDRLLILIPDDWSFRNKYTDLSFLTDWSQVERYPDTVFDASEEATEIDAIEAVQQARDIFELVVNDFIAKGFNY